MRRRCSAGKEVLRVQVLQLVPGPVLLRGLLLLLVLSCWGLCWGLCWVLLLRLRCQGCCA